VSKENISKEKINFFETLVRHVSYECFTGVGYNVGQVSYEFETLVRHMSYDFFTSIRIIRHVSDECHTSVGHRDMPNHKGVRDS
jgi:hypothetical protein